MDLKPKIAHFIKEEFLAPKGSLVLIGLSGGADSTCLTVILHELRYALGINLAAAHFDHSLRKGSSSDEAFSRSLAQKLNIPYYPGKWDKPGKLKDVSEELAREARLEFLIATARKIKADTIALAHNKNDVAETILMRILRGSGLQGLRSILPRNELYGFSFIRPLLCARRDEIEKYLKHKMMDFRVDETNSETRFFRNKIRLKLLPFLEREFKGSVIDNLYSLSSVIAADYEFLQKEARRAFLGQAVKSGKVSFNIKAFLLYPLAIRRMLIRLAYENLNGSADKLAFYHVEKALKFAHGREEKSLCELPCRIVVLRSDKSLVFTKKKSGPAAK
ncbi:MAG: tRNA lysidine(34) synthetase TilS [Candidatus Omnitrophica bacterium]|nr:tRNA lysidine(34) synthetase TilS [Candidatus Omnitrophota bacterium]